ncbi:MAG: hypothetical protein AABW83_00380 [Nanoarchaeota archaeon]
MSQEHFSVNEKRIFKEMKERGRKALETGLVCSLPKEGEIKSGYLIYLVHNKDIECRISEFSSELSKVLNGNSVLHTNSWGHKKMGNIHTTIATYEMKTVQSFNPDRDILHELSDISDESIYNFLEMRVNGNPSLVLNYSEFIYDESTVIAESHGDTKDFFELTENVIKIASVGEKKLNKTWGRYISVGRFKDNIPSDKLDKFRELMNEASFSEDTKNKEVVSLNTGYFMLSNKEYNLFPYSAFYF